MKPTRNHEARQAFQFGRVIGALQAAKAMGSEVINPDTVRRLRPEVTATILKRASIVGKARHMRGYNVAQHYALALKERLIEHRKQTQARRVVPNKAVEQLRAILGAYTLEERDCSTQSRNVAEVTRFNLETATPVEPSALREKLRQALGFESASEMGAAGVEIKTPSIEASNRVFSVSFAVPQAKLTLPISQITSMLRSATGATRLTKVPRSDLGSDLAKFRRLIETHFGLKRGRWPLQTPEKDEISCCCYCGRVPESPPHGPPGGHSARPTWTSVPDDTEWHLKQMLIKEAWGIKPPTGGKSQGEGILIAHPDTGWREHREYDQSQLRFDLARDIIEGKDGKDATRHSTEGLFTGHGTGTGTTIVSAEASQKRTHVGDIPFQQMIPTSSNVQLTGIAPRAELVPIRCTDSPIVWMDPNIQKAIEYAIKIKAHVISMSLGGILDADCERAIDRAVLDHNIIVVAAAGQLANWVTNNNVLEPASFTNVVAVAGSTYALAPWWWSCHGPKVAVSAPAEGVWYAGHSPEGTPTIAWGAGTSLSTAAVAGVAALWLAHWGRDSLMARYRDVPLGHVFRHLLRKTAWKPRNWDRLYGAGIVDAYALLNEPLPNSSDVVSPRETDEFNPFDAFSDFLDLGGAIARQIWDGVIGVGGAVGDFFGELFNLNVLSEGLAVLSAMAEGAAGDMKAWADEQSANLWTMVDDSLSVAGDAWDAVSEGGNEAVEAVGDVIEEGGDLMEDISDAAAETWDQTVDYFASLWPE